MRRCLPILLAALCWTAHAWAQPAEVSRVLRRFDFEERRFNVEELPVDWQKVEGQGLPHYVNGRLSTDSARSGRYSFRFDLNGGSLIYRYPAGKITARRDAHYRIEAFARTTALANARARLTAYFADIDGRPIPSTVRHSEPFATPPGTPDAWRLLSIELTADDERAASLVIELGLVQPSIFRASSLGARALFGQDIRGSAWFDDLTVSQVPRVTLSTDRPGNIFPAGDPMVVRVEVNDRFTDDLAAQLVIRDVEGRLVFQKSQALDLGSARQVSEGVKVLSVTLPQLPVGWFDVAVAMSSQGEVLGEQGLAVLRLPDAGEPVVPDDRIGVVATGLPFEAWDQLPDLLPMIGAGRVKLAVWSSSGDAVQSDAGRFDRLLEELQRRRIIVTACLSGLPPGVAAKVGGAGWIDLLKAPREAWQPELSYLVARHANHLDRWQLGPDGTDAFAVDPAMRQVYDKVLAEFSQLIQNPNLAMPWPAWYELDPSAPRSIAMTLPPSVLPEQIPLYVQEMRTGAVPSGEAGSLATAAPPARLSLTLEPLDPARYGRATTIRDFAQRFAYALAAGARQIDVPLPFEALPGPAGTPPMTQPRELLLVLRTLSQCLGNAAFMGRVPIADNVEAFLFDRGGQGILMLWSKGNQAGVTELALNLGPRAAQVDLWGNVTPLLPGDRRRQTARLQLGPMPIFLIDIDGEMARLRAGIAWDNPRVESSFRPHVRKLRFTNPYRSVIAGNFRLRGPNGWVLSPPAQSFSLNPGETFERDITIEFPYNTYAGPKPVNIEFALQAGAANADEAFSVNVPLQLGLSDVGLQTFAFRDGADVLVQQMVTNYGERPIDYTAFAVLPGSARQERLITNLGPGRTTIRRYRFTAPQDTPTQRVRSGIRELNGTRILNDEVEVR